jgi:hypothetical protein
LQDTSRTRSSRTPSPLGGLCSSIIRLRGLHSGGPTPQMIRWRNLLDGRSGSCSSPRLHQTIRSPVCDTRFTPHRVTAEPALHRRACPSTSWTATVHLYARKSGASDSGSRSQPCVKTRLSRGLVLWLHLLSHALWHRVPSPRRTVRTRVLFLKAISPYTTPPYSHAQIFRAVHRPQE